MQFVSRKISCKRLVVVAQVVLHVDDRRAQELADDLGDDVANVAVLLKSRHVLAQVLRKRGQVEVPVLDRTHLGNRAGKGRLGLDKLFGGVAMTKVALVGVGMLGLASLHRAMAVNLTSVQERLGLRVVELKSRALLKEAVLVQTGDELVGHALMNLTRMTDTRALVDGQADVVRVERGLLSIVVASDVIVDGAFELAGFDQLTIALVDGRAEAVGSADEAHVFRTDTVAQEARVRVGGHENAGDVAKMKRLVTIRHARRDDRTSRPRQTLIAQIGFVVIELHVRIAPSKAMPNRCLIRSLPKGSRG